ncbi:MAG: ChaN family lipoprotein [Bacteroidales bacterium]|nr:ChaN family lipoprotein [Bacteroidales bacterium]
MNRIIVFVMLIFIMGSFKNDKPSYQIYNSKGKNVKYKKLLKAASKADVIFFGELHNNPIDHWLQLELCKDLSEINKGQISLGAEMFERDNAADLEAYVNGDISESMFEEKVRFWNNYKTDYRPLVEFAKTNSLDFVATNIPRKYASMVHKNGFESLEKLSEIEKTFVAPLPIEYDPNLKCYADMLKMMGGMSHASANLPKAQAIKDATMAFSIIEKYKDGVPFIHFNGTYHSNNNQGIIWYLKKYMPELRVMTISTVEQEDIFKFEKENTALADFVLVISENMTKTY